ncbi:glucosaminidase domain-containing protein [Saccharospirillum sp. MSK14-1]|uniref:glucosaminidase domain-containing protein n=1 Tax=Saccharospirillum sp. MSK14-1 TaxID=1897632 RepID=UPI000D3CE833|nr:glucosaminidase domain-containing protein [Saccharospirillum sp. MSK14-1]
MTRHLPLIGLMLVLLLALATGLNTYPTTPKAPDFTTFSEGDERKNAFFAYFEQLIDAENEAILSSREKLTEIIANDQARWVDRLWLASLANRYELDDFESSNVEHWNALLIHVDIVPPSLALAQAANESAWGTSRFAREGNNYFGQWCYSRGCGLVPEARDDDASHEVARFSSARQSVRRYVNNINTHYAYAELRERRAQLRAADEPVTGLALAPTLINYSQRGQAYVDELDAIIRFNELTAYDG